MGCAVKICGSGFAGTAKMRAVSAFLAQSQECFLEVLHSSTLSPIIFVLFKDRLLRWEKYVPFGNLRIAFLFIADDAVLLASLVPDLQQTAEWFASDCEIPSMRLSTYSSWGIWLRCLVTATIWSFSEYIGKTQNPGLYTLFVFGMT